jgi:hypothetical protein
MSKDHPSVPAQLQALRQRVAALEAAHQELEARVRELSEQNGSLVQLTVASQLLSASFVREDVLSAIDEVVVNMIGSEEFAIYDVGSDGQALTVARLRGIDPASPRLRLASAAIRHAVRAGRTFVPSSTRASADSTNGGLTAVVPLKIERQVTGAVAIFRLLEQKAALDPTDHDLFEILSRQAALALHSTACGSLRPTVRPPTGSRSHAHG